MIPQNVNSLFTLRTLTIYVNSYLIVRNEAKVADLLTNIYGYTFEYRLHLNYKHTNFHLFNDLCARKQRDLKYYIFNNKP